ncbi:SOS response-associated peptidase [Patescibacteria group bacterium]|nr:SOS response-associated peptidase [Patescibacteria group bacterium]MBU0963486.1 SOS response-associated peptidase [Patescibacteria group bacterium]
MCGRYSFFSKDDILEDRFQAHFNIPIQRHYNAAPTQKLPVILNDNPKEIVPGQWGLIPRWLKDKPGRGLINARAETLTEKPSFRNAVKKHRCLVLADSFFEWTRQASTKIPYRILLKNERPFAFAGIWEFYKNKQGVTFPTFSIITTPANNMISELHDRMPAILEPKYEQLWIDDSTELEAALETLKPLPANQMKMYQVSPQMNSVRYESEDIIKPT